MDRHKRQTLPDNRNGSSAYDVLVKKRKMDPTQSNMIHTREFIMLNLLVESQTNMMHLFPNQCPARARKRPNRRLLLRIKAAKEVHLIPTQGFPTSRRKKPHDSSNSTTKLLRQGPNTNTPGPSKEFSKTSIDGETLSHTHL